MFSKRHSGLNLEFPSEFWYSNTACTEKSLIEGSCTVATSLSEFLLVDIDLSLR